MSPTHPDQSDYTNTAGVDTQRLGRLKPEVTGFSWSVGSINQSVNFAPLTGQDDDIIIFHHDFRFAFTVM